MKKKIIGVVAAALLLGSSIGYAASSSLIGAKVTGLFTLQYTDKTKIADAVIINGSAYVPVRKMAEATGTELTVEGKSITLADKSVVESIDNTAQIKELSEKQTTLTRNETQITNLKGIQASGYADEVASPSYKYELTESYAKTTAEIKRLTEENEQLRSDIAELKTQLGE